MTKVILLSALAQKQFEGLDKTTKDRVRLTLKNLSNVRDCNGAGLDIKKLKGVKGREDLFRLRVGVYRIIYHEEKDSIKVLQILHRHEAYKWL
jgi:mRNA interferase RelE/StbE